MRANIIESSCKYAKYSGMEELCGIKWMLYVPMANNSPDDEDESSCFSQVPIDQVIMIADSDVAFTVSRAQSTWMEG